MSSLILPRSGITPSYAAGFGRSAAESANPGLWKGLQGAYIAALGPTGGILHDVSGHGRDGTLSGGLGGSDWTVDGGYQGLLYNGESDYVALPNVLPLGLGEYSIVTRFYLVGWGESSYGRLYSAGNSVSHGVSLSLNHVSSADRIDLYHHPGGDFASTSTSALSLGNVYDAVATVSGGTTATIYVDGVDETADASITSPTAMPAGHLESIGRRGYDNKRFFDGIIFTTFVYDRALTPNEVLQYHVDPLAPFRLAPLYISTPAAGADTTIDCTLGTVTIAGLAASIDAQTTISCSLGTVSVAGLAAGIDAQTTIACSLGTVSVAGLAASIEAQTTLACSLGTVSIAGLQATITAGTTISCSLGTVSISGLAASIDAQTTIACGLGTVSVAGLQASIVTGTNIPCSLGTVSISGLQASIVAATTIECSLGTVAISGLTAGIDAQTTLSCTLGTVDIAGLTAAILADVSIECSLGTVQITGLQATISTGQANIIGMVAKEVFTPGLIAHEVFTPGMTAKEVRP